MDRGGESVLVQKEKYVVGESVRNCTNRFRRSEREFVADHAHLHAQMPWYRDGQLEDAAWWVCLWR